MNILAIDTITPNLTVTARGEKGSATISVASDTQHAERILEVIETALTLAFFSVRETNLVICAEGPGSFTGLRLAYSTAKAIQLAAGCDLATVPTLICFAHPYLSWPGAVISVLDAKKKRFYVQVFRNGVQATEPLDIAVSEVLQCIDPSERILITGPDALLFAGELAASVPGLDASAVPYGTYAIADVISAIAENRFPYYTENVPDHAGPLYVRKSDAETNTAG